MNWIFKKSLFFSPAVLDRETQSLHPTFVEYIDGARIYLENETDKEAPAVRDIKLHFCNFIRKMIKSFSRKRFYSNNPEFRNQNMFNVLRDLLSFSYFF